MAYVGSRSAEAEVEEIRTDLRSRGWYLRYTEWPLGHEVVLHRRNDTSQHLVTDWHSSELEAWRDARALALEWEQRADAADAEPSALGSLS